jgi:hypothetical protein
MAYYITKSSLVNGSTMYYKGNRHWSDQPGGKKTYATEAAANAEMVNTDGTNGGWKGATVVSE